MEAGGGFVGGGEGEDEIVAAGRAGDLEADGEVGSVEATANGDGGEPVEIPGGGVAEVAEGGLGAEFKGGRGRGGGDEEVGLGEEALAGGGAEFVHFAAGEDVVGREDFGAALDTGACLRVVFFGTAGEHVAMIGVGLGDDDSAVRVGEHGQLRGGFERGKRDFADFGGEFPESFKG